MGVIGDKIQEKISYNERFTNGDVCGVITEVDTFRNTASIRFPNPTNGVVTNVDNVKLPVNVGGITESSVEPGQRCWITFLNGSPLKPIISSLSDELYYDNIYSKKTNSDQGGFVVNEYINTIDLEEVDSPMSGDYFVDAPTDIFSLVGRDYTDLDALEETKKSIIQLDKYKDTEDGVSNKKTSSTIKFKENGDIDTFVKANVGIRLSKFRIHTYSLEMFNWGKNMTNNFTEDITNNSKNLTNNQEENITNNSEYLINNQRKDIENNSENIINNTRKTITSNAKNIVNNIEENITNNVKKTIINKAKDITNNIKNKYFTEAKEIVIHAFKDILVECRNLIVNCDKIIYNKVELTSDDLQRLLELLELDWDAIRDLVDMYRDGYFDNLAKNEYTVEAFQELLEYETTEIQSLVSMLRRITKTPSALASINELQDKIDEYNQIKQDLADDNISVNDLKQKYIRAEELINTFKEEIREYENS